VFGPASKARSKLRALIPVADPDDTANPRCPASGVPGVPTSSRARRLPWADLLRRVFAEDVLHCPCGGHRSVTAFVVDERLVRSLLTTLGLAAEPATFAPTRAPPQVEFAWDDHEAATGRSAITWRERDKVRARRGGAGPEGAARHAARLPGAGRRATARKSRAADRGGIVTRPQRW
jgi:hypothetical protein